MQAPTRNSLLRLLVAAAALGVMDAAQPYYGKYLGKLKTLHHGVTGEVYAVDARTLHIRDFSYDGEGPAAFFWAGDTKSPSSYGFKVNDEQGSTNVLQRYRKKHITLTLPDNKTLRDIKWFSVWCDEFAVNFGDVKIPKNFDYPKPQKIDALDGVHAVSSDNIVIVDAQTLLVPNFSYDGEAPDAKFWVGRGAKPSSQGVRVPDENGREEPLRRYDRKTLVLTLPADLTVLDVGHFGVWCEAFAVDFGHVRLPASLNVPPSLKMLGVSAQSKLNCEVLHDALALEVRWAVAGDSIVMQLVGKVEPGDYMAFGLSGHPERTRMVGGDVAVAWVDHETLAGAADDYFLDAKSQCAGGTGSCPDFRIREGTGSVRLLNAALVNGYSIVTFQRSLRARDELDLPVLTNQSQAVIWAVGPLNARRETSFHHTFNKHDVLVDFGRSPRWNCPLPDADAVHHSTAAATSITTAAPSRRRGPPRTTAAPATEAPETTQAPRRTSRPRATPAPVARVADPWHIPAIPCYEPEDGVFYAQMGPTGGKRGYPAITGHVGWGISWYINGLLIPEINVVRGKTYTFVVEGGLDPETPARYHPFYITDDPVGGYEHKTPEERAAVRVLAGVSVTRRGEPFPTGTGRLCNWTPDPEQPPADEFASFGAYQRTLSLQCDDGEPGVVQWTPGPDTPDTVYYQCYTHRYLGWKINVLDSCDVGASASEAVGVATGSGSHDQSAEDDAEDGELQSRASIRVTTRVRPNGVFYGGDKAVTREKNNGADTVYTSSQDYVTPYSYSTIVRDQPEDEDKTYTSSSYVSRYVPQKEIHAFQAPKKKPDFPSRTEIQKPKSPSEPTTTIQQGKYSSANESKDANTSRSTTSYVSRWKESYHSDHGSLTAIDPMRRPVIHVTTPYSLVLHTDDVVDVSPQQPLKTQDTLQELQQDSYLPIDNNRRPAETALELTSISASHSSHQQTTVNRTSPIPATVSYAHSKAPTNSFPTAIMNHRPLKVNPTFRRPVVHPNYGPIRRPVAPPNLRIPYISTLPPQNYGLGLKKHFYRTPNMDTYRPLASSPMVQRPMTQYPSSPKPTPLVAAVHKLSTPLQRNSQRVTPSVGHSFENATEIPSAAVQGATSSVVASPTHTVPGNIPHSNEGSGNKAPLTFSSGVQHGSGDPVMILPAAVNTGFHPESVIVEGGFKPITQKNAAAEDRSSADGDALTATHNDAAERLDTELTAELPLETLDDSKKENPFQGQRPELFEPMFIPSPPDRIINNASGVSLKKPVSLPDELTPPAANIHHRNSGQPLRNPPHVFSNRPRPGNMRRPLYPSGNIPPFLIQNRGNGPSFRHQQKSEESLDETPMAAERLDTYYLPPDDYKSISTRNQGNPPSTIDATIAPDTVVTYDGKSVVDASLASSISNPLAESSASYRNPTGTAALIRELPQFGPFRGEIPPPVPSVVQPENIPQLRVQNQKRAQTLPLHFSPDNSQRSFGVSSVNYRGSQSGRSTQLTLVRQAESTADTSELDLLSEASEIKEYVLPSKVRKQKGAKKVVVPKLVEADQLPDRDIVLAEDLQNKQDGLIPRRRRSPAAHHEPGHQTTETHEDHEEERAHIHVEDMRSATRGKPGSGALDICRINLSLILASLAILFCL